ncbi:cation diffusion facilitator family transporter [Thalassomonas sp. M1454]|uniref:cation diffusion facilitator family transporter n=1 Tax=Thalassomonas sp. M1454 TaxID=2594477 RepID=UPI00117D083C|nr:cation diffusion facilitator family transporter [Thalassomonas sp. M1454]TRX57919.1 cation diffusion facilitator family transporter [Thalassomonas sp. M1454]
MSNQSYENLVKLASKMAILVAAILVVSKLYAWWISSSSAMLASTTDSILDVFASLCSFIIIRFSLSPADKEHRFGHGKAENLAALMQSSFVLGSAILLMFHGVDRVISPQVVSHSSTAIAISVLAIVLTIALISVQKYVISKTNSVAIGADSLHYQSDLLLNAGVILALVLNQYNWPQADGVFTVFVGLFLLSGAVKIIYHSIHDLMDRELDEQDLASIKAVINSHPKAHGFHELRTRQAGKMRFIQFHLELDDNLSLLQAHQISDEVEQELLKIFNDTEVFIHQDPQSVVAKELTKQIS